MRLPRRARASVAACAAAIAIVGVGLRPAGQSAKTAAGRTSQEDFDELYRRGQRINANIRTLTARVTETTSSSLLVDPLVSTGTLVVQRPSRVALRFTEPERRIVLIEDDRMITVWPSRGMRQVTNVASTQRRVQKYLSSDSPAELRSQFAIERPDAHERPGTFAIGLVPKRRQIRETTTRFDLWIDSSSFLLGAIRVTFANGDTKTMVFDDIVTNVVIDPAAFLER